MKDKLYKIFHKYALKDGDWSKYDGRRTCLVVEEIFETFCKNAQDLNMDAVRKLGDDKINITP